MESLILEFKDTNAWLVKGPCNLIIQNSKQFWNFDILNCNQNAKTINFKMIFEFLIFRILHKHVQMPCIRRVTLNNSKLKPIYGF